MPNFKGTQYRPSEMEKQDLRERYLAGEPWNVLRTEFQGSEGALGNILRGLKSHRANGLHDKQLKTLNALDPIDVGWTAGIIDGEGYIGLSRLRDGLYFQPRVVVRSTTKCMQDRLETLFGGHQRVCLKVRPNERVQYDWSLWTIPTVRAFLVFIAPHLVVKGEVARVTLRFCERHARQKLQPATKQDERDYVRVRFLNRRGTCG